MNNTASFLAPVLGLFVGALLSSSSASRNWWRDKRAVAYGAALAEVEALRHRLDSLTEPANSYSLPPLDSDDLVNLTREYRAAQAGALLYAGRQVETAMSDFLKLIRGLADTLPIEIPYGQVEAAAEKVARAMQSELKGRRFRPWAR